MWLNSNIDTIIKGIGVKLEPLRLDHIDELYSVSTDEEIWKFSAKRIINKPDMEKLVTEALENKTKGLEYPFIIYDLPTNKIIGSTRFLNISESHKNLDIGWTWLNPKYWGLKANVECKYLLLKYAFEELNAIRVHFILDANNQY